MLDAAKILGQHPSPKLVSDLSSLPTMHPAVPKPKRIKKPVDLKVLCWICGAAAADHLHYGAICCYSCRAFFRRSGLRKYVCVDKSNMCDVTPNNRKQCKLCRYTRCLSVGMRPEMVDATLARRREEDEYQTPDTNSHEDIAMDASEDHDEGSNISERNNASRHQEIKVDHNVRQRNFVDYWNENEINSLANETKSKHSTSERVKVEKDICNTPHLSGLPHTQPSCSKWPTSSKYPYSHMNVSVMAQVEAFNHSDTGKEENQGFDREPKAGLNIVTVNKTFYNTSYQYLENNIKTETASKIAEDMKTVREDTNMIDMTQAVTMSYGHHDLTGYHAGAGTGAYSDRYIMPGVSTEYGDGKRNPWSINDYKVIPESIIMPHLKCKANSQEDVSNTSNKVSVIKKNPVSSQPSVFPATFTNPIIPLKKRESVKEWILYCQKLSLSLQGTPSFILTSEESLFIDQKVSETKALVLLLHENCHKYLDEREAYKTAEGLDTEKNHCVEIFRAKAGDIFGKQLDGSKNQSLAEIYSSNLIKSRFLCCAMAAVAVRLFGGPDVDCFPHNHQFYQKYTFLLKSPWASSLEFESEAENTFRNLGAIIGADKRMEVLFTSAIMRCFRDISPAQPSSTLRTPDLLTGSQFSLLLFRYLKNNREQEESVTIFQKLASLVQPLYEATNSFYYERLKF